MSQAELIRQRIEELPTGQPFTPAAFLSIAERTTVDKTLGRMLRAGYLIRPTRGVFVRPKESRFGSVPPELMQVVIAKANGAPIEIHGAEAVRRFGLSTQVPVRPVFYTSGRSKSFNIGKITVSLQHVSPRKLVSPGTPVGMAISALWYLGKEQVNNQVFEVIRSELSVEEYAQLKSAASKMPSWMSDALHKYEKTRANG